MMYYLAKIVSSICCMMPFGLAEAIGNFLGSFSWLVVPKWRKKMAIDNIKRCLGVDEEEARRIAKESWVRFGPMLMEVMRFPVIHERMTELVEIAGDGAKLLRDGLALGKGGIIATAHSGNWELMGGALSAMGFPIVGVAQKQKEADFDKFINEYRRMVGMHITYKGDVREMYDMLKKGWIIGLLMDQDISVRDGIVFDWFGRATNFVQGPATFARYRGAPLFPGYIHRLENGRDYFLVVEIDETPVPLNHVFDHGCPNWGYRFCCSIRGLVGRPADNKGRTFPGPFIGFSRKKLSTGL